MRGAAFSSRIGSGQGLGPLPFHHGPHPLRVRDQAVEAGIEADERVHLVVDERRQRVFQELLQKLLMRVVLADAEPASVGVAINALEGAIVAPFLKPLACLFLGRRVAKTAG